jgi:alpha-tubulin suppressor-like RCC1 family protein
MRKLSGARWQRGWPVGRPLVVGGLAVSAALLIPSAPKASAAAASQPATVAPAATAAQPAAASVTSLRAWGRNDRGQLGDDSQVNRRLPATPQIPPAVKIVSVQGGCLHTLALTSTGKVLAWGDDTAGQLGDGLFFTGISTTPVTVKIPAGTKITAIRAGCNFGLALTSTGSVLAWGSNPGGVLGTASTAGAIFKPIPVQFPPGTKIKGISAGSDYSLAVTTAGAVYAWGDNGNGQLGDGTTTTQTTPEAIGLLRSGVTLVAAGQSHSLALTAGHAVLAWGLNDDGELGDGTTSSATFPQEVALPAGTQVSGLFAGAGHSLALTTTGKVFAWGDNSSGQLGDGTNRSTDVAVAVKFPQGTKVTAISAGWAHNLALTSTGKILAWGDGKSGVLGNGFTLDRELPMPVKLPAGLVATAIGAGPTAQASFAIVH